MTPSLHLSFSCNCRYPAQYRPKPYTSNTVLPFPCHHCAEYAAFSAEERVCANEDPKLEAASKKVLEARKWERETDDHDWLREARRTEERLRWQRDVKIANCWREFIARWR